MRILWLGNPPMVGSGYGEQAGLFVPRLKALGHDVAVACNWGLQGSLSQWHGITLYPSDGNWGNDSIDTYAEHHQADIVVALCDAWVLKPDMWQSRMAVWAPIDHYPIPPAVLATLAHERVRPIAMSRFGERLMRQCGLDPLYIPHGVDTERFRPQPDARDEIRDELGIPKDAFLVGMVAANKGNPSLPRKGFPQAFLAFSRFAKDHRDAHMYVHTQAVPPKGGGINLDKLAVASGCPIDRLRFPPDKAWHMGMSADLMGNLYQAFDVLLNPAMGEGFGVPVLEAMACGVPVIASDHSAMSELVRDTGWLVSGDPWWDALQDSFLIVPSVDSIVELLEHAYDAREDQGVKDAAVTFAKSYDANLVTFDHWLPALEKLESPRSIPPLNGALNRQQRRALAKRKVAA